MRITRMALTNFGCFAERQFQFEKPRTLLVGLNAAGKSTILDAVQYLVTGRCRGLDAAGRGMDQVALTGSNGVGTKVEANIVIGDVTYEVVRAWVQGTSAFQVKPFNSQGEDWGDGSLSSTEAAWLKKLGLSLPALQAVLNADVLLSMAHGDAKALLLEFLQVRIPVGEGEDPITLAECERWYTLAYEERARLKRQLASTQKPVAPQGQVGDIEAIRARLQGLDAELQTALETQGASRGTQKALWEEYHRLATRQQALSQADGPEAALDALETERSTLLAQVGPAERAWEALVEKLAETKAAAVPLPTSETDKLDLIRKHEPSQGCVLNPGIECKTSLTQFVTFAKKHDTTAAKAKLAEVSGGVRKLEAEVETKKAEHRTILKRLDVLVEQINAAKRRTDELASITSRMDEIAPHLEDAPAGTDDGQVAIDSLKERTAKGREILERNLRTQAEQARYEKDHAAYEALVQAKDQAEADVLRYGPKGVRVQALDAGIGSFCAEVNAYLQPFGYELAVSVDPWDWLVNGRPLVRLSGAERLRAGIALQVAMAVRSGIGLTLIDEVERLLTDQRRILGQVLATASLEQVVMAKAEDHPEAIKAGANLSVIAL